MQDGIGTGSNAFDAYLPISWMKQGQQFRGAIFDIFMGIRLRLSPKLPMGTRIGASLIGASFILCPNGEALLLGYGVCLLDEFFLAIASGSVTSTGPLLRTRMTLPVSHQERSCFQA
jgi:hypothetical protein